MNNTNDTFAIIISILLVIAVIAAIIFCIRFVRLKACYESGLREAKSAGEAELKDTVNGYEIRLREKDNQIEGLNAQHNLELKAKDDQIENLKVSHETELRRVGESHDKVLKGKDEYIEKMETLHAEALKKSDEVHADALRKSDEVHAEAMRELKEQQAEALGKVEEQHKRDMETMKDQFKVTATEILGENTKEFSERSSEKIGSLLSPVREKFEEFSKKVEESDKGRVEMQAAIKEQVSAIMDQSRRVSDSADNLANALTYNPKSQGDFGEMILRDILLNNGFVEDINFKCQGVMTDENGHEIKGSEGQTLIPDVLVYYPDNTVVVVDSKISLTDYVRYCTETTEEGKRDALKAHIESIRKHINELANKDYASYIPLGNKKVDFNIMFIPNEGAFTLMLEESPRLWHEARERNVYVVSQQTLIIVLNMIQLVWKQSEREKNVDSIVKAASELMTSIGTWLDEHVKIGDQIDKLSKTYDSATKKLRSGGQNVVQKIGKLESLGAAPKSKAISKGGVRKSGPESVVPAVLSEGAGFGISDDIPAVDASPANDDSDNQDEAKWVRAAF